MKHIVVGTAGHIDHGKTSLVRALTGIDTDRLEEEKRRGISIDLGFAHLDLAPGLRVAFIDVPGHERFIKNMLAGVGGIDLVLLVVAADESIKPQTREHFQICRLLQIPRGLVVLTKADMVDADLLELVKLEVEEFVQGSFLEGAPIVPVSSVTRQGIDDLRQKLEAVARTVPARATDQYLRLPMDRAFTLKGFGTVVTGTLQAGSVQPEQEVVAEPGGRALRVRTVQVHGAAVKRASAGQRTALNVTGAEVEQLHRGQVLTESGRFHPTQLIDCQLDLLEGAKPLKARAPVHFHAGTAEVEAEVRHLASAQSIKPGSRALVRIKLREPLLLLPGDRFIIRMFSPVVTIGGGSVLDAAPPKTRQSEAVVRLTQLAEADEPGRIAQFVREARYGLSLASLVARTGRTEAALLASVPADRVLVLKEPAVWLTDRARWQEFGAALQKLLADFHRAHPLLPGIPKEDARHRILKDAPPSLMDELLRQSPGVVAEAEVLRLKTHKLALQQDEEQAIAKMEGLFQEAGLAVPGLAEVLGRAGVDATRARSLMQVLFRQQKLIKIGDDLVFHQTALQQLRTLLTQHAGQRFSVAEFKNWTGVSRKYAIPLLEYLDRQRLTRREGDERVVL